MYEHGVAGTVEVHFENKDGGFFLKHTPRQYYPAVADLAGASGPLSPPQGPPKPPQAPVQASPGSSILSVDRFTVFQTSQPISIRATYGPFSTKQTVPARYIVPDPLDSLPLPGSRSVMANSSSASVPLDLDLTAAAASHHLDMSAHVVRPEIPRDSPVLRVLFHAGSEAGLGRRQMPRHQRVCIVLHATLGERTPLTAACSPDGEDGVCLAQVTVPASWWPPLPPPSRGDGAKPVKTPPRLVQLAFSVLEPRGGKDDEDGSCAPRVQIQPVTPLATVPLVAARATYRELRTDELLTMLVPHAPLYPLSRVHIPVFLQPRLDYPVSVFIIRARVKSGLRLLGAEASSDQWNVSVELNPKHTVATVTAFKREGSEQTQTGPIQLKTAARSEEVFSWLLEVVEDSSDLWDGGRVVWSVRYILEGSEAAAFPRQHARRGASHRAHQQRDAAGHAEEARRKLSARLEIQKDDIQAVLPISKSWGVMNTAVLTGRQVSQAMKVFIVSQAGKVADVTLQSSCHSEDESVLKVSSSCSSVYVDGSEIRGSSNASVLVKYGTYTGLAKFTVWMPEFPLEVNVADFRLSQVKGWKVPGDHTSSVKMKRSLDDLHGNRGSTYRGWGDSGAVSPDDLNGVDPDRHLSCRIRFQQSPVEVFARFLAKDHDSGSERYFVSRRTSLRVTDLVLSLLRVSDPRIASLHGRILQGRGMGRTEVQVLSPITGRVIGAKEVRVGNDKVSISRLQVRVVSGLQLAITPDSAVENGYIAETSVTRRLTAQYQEGLLDIDLEFSDGSRTPLREVAVSDYHLLVESLDPEVVAFAPMVASHHPRVIAVGEGRSDLLHVALLLAEECRAVPRRAVSGKLPGSGKPNSNAPLAAASAYVEVDFSASDIPQRPEFVQNDGGGVVGGNHGSRDRKNNRDMPADMHDIHIGIPIKDENNHEPTVQARQHHSAAKGLAPAGLGHHHHNNMHMTPLEIGMYVLLAAFCFAIVVFVVSCVVYASKFKPQTMECPSHPAIAGGSTGLEPLGASVGKSVGNEGMGIGGASGINSALGGKKQPRESTTNAHDWVWLGRATLERASGHVIVGASLSGRSPPIFNNNNNVAVGSKDDQQICITTNPMNYTVETLEEGQNLGTCFDNPNHIDLPSRVPAIDSSTYCKKEKVPGRHQFVAHNSPSRSTHHKPQYKESAADKLWQIPPPPPLPPHGMSLGVKPVGGVTVVDGVEYKPPVPPHRNIGVSARIGPSRQQPGPLPGFLPQQDGATARGAVPQTPAPSRRHHHHHHHHRNSGSNHHRAGKSSTTSHQQDQDCKMEDNGVPHQKPSASNLCAELQQHQMRHQGKEDPLAPKNHLKRQSKEDRYYTTMKEDEDEDECHQETAFVEFPSASGGTTSAQRKGNSPEVKRATIVGNPMFSAADDVDEDFRLREELLGLEDLNLGMDYEQIMEYFDNLKESNA